MKDIDKFEKNNPTISICVLSLDENNKPYPLRMFTNTEAQHKIHLLHLFNEKSNHYVLIKSLQRLMNYDGKNVVYVCENCLTAYTTADALKNHQTNGCLDHQASRIILPNEDDAKLKFNAIKKQLRKPFVVYADFESLIVKERNEDGVEVEKHVCCSYGYKIVSTYPEYTRPY